MPTVPAPADLTGGLAYVQDTTIYLRPAGGGPALPLINERQDYRLSHLRWSPSGRRLLYLAEVPARSIPESHLIVYDFDQHRRTDLGPNRSAVWHPDGEHIAVSYRLVTETYTHVHIITVATGAVEDLGVGYAPTWSADGKHLAVWRGDNLWLLPYPSNGGRPQQITHLPMSTTGPPARYVIDLLYDPSGRVLLFGGEDNQIAGNGAGMYMAAADLRTGAIHPLAPPQAGARAHFGLAAPPSRPLATEWPDPLLIDWELSPDGRYLAWEEAPFGGHAISILDLKTNAVLHPAVPASHEHRSFGYGLSWAAGDKLALAYQEFYAFLEPEQPPLPPLSLYQTDLGDLARLQPLGAGAWPAWNRGRK